MRKEFEHKAAALILKEVLRDVVIANAAVIFDAAFNSADLWPFRLEANCSIVLPFLHSNGPRLSQLVIGS
jgi:hypothetical protein